MGLAKSIMELWIKNDTPAHMVTVASSFVKANHTVKLASFLPDGIRRPSYPNRRTPLFERDSLLLQLP